MNLNLSHIFARLLDLINKYFKYFAIVFFIAVITIGYLSVLKPKWDEINSTGVFDYNSETIQLEENRVYLEKLKVSLEKYKSINQANIEKLSKIIPSEDEIPELFVILEDIVEKLGLKLQAIDISKEEIATVGGATPSAAQGGVSGTNAQEAAGSVPSKNIHALDISLEVSGGKSYENLKSLLESLESELRIMDVSAVSFEVTQAAGEEEQQYSLKLFTYYIN